MPGFLFCARVSIFGIVGVGRRATLLRSNRPRKSLQSEPSDGSPATGAQRREPSDGSPATGAQRREPTMDPDNWNIWKILKTVDFLFDKRAGAPMLV